MVILIVIYVDDLLITENDSREINVNVKNNGTRLHYIIGYEIKINIPI